MAGASVEYDEALMEVVSAAINHSREDFNIGDPSPVQILLAAIQKWPDDAPAIEAIVEGIVSAGKPPPVEAMVDDILEEAILRARLEMKRYSARSIALKAFTNAVQVSDIGFSAKYALFKQAILAHGDKKTEKESSLMDERLRESLMAVIELIKSKEFVGRPVSVAELVGLLLEYSGNHEPSMRQAVMERLIQASRVPLSQSAMDAIFTSSFRIAVEQVREMTLLESPEEALMAAVDRSTDKPFTKEVCKKAIVCSSKELEAEKKYMGKAFKDAATAAIDYVTEGQSLEYCPMGHFVHSMSAWTNSIGLIEENLINQLIVCTKPASAQYSARMHACIRLLARHSKVPPAQIDYSQPEEKEDLHQFLDFFNSAIVFGGRTPLVFLPSQSVSKESYSIEDSADAVFREAIKSAIERLQSPPSSLSPEEAILVSVEHLPHISSHRWELLKQIILAEKSNPDDDLVDQALKEALLSAIVKTRRAMSDSGPKIFKFDLLKGRNVHFQGDFIRFLMEAIIEESVLEQTMKHVVIKRVLFACKPTQPEHSGKQILSMAFRAAIWQLIRREPNRLESPEGALAAAIEKSTFPPLVKHVFTELVMSTVFDRASGLKRSRLQFASNWEYSRAAPKPHWLCSFDDSSGDEDTTVLDSPVRLPLPSKFKIKQKFKVQK